MSEEHTADTKLQKLHPDYLKIMRLRTLFGALFLIAGAAVGEFTSDGLPHGVILGPVILLSLAYVRVIPQRRYRRKGFAMGADRLRIVTGFLFFSDTVVPFGRVQHLDVTQNPLERAYGLASLVLHTAGTHNSSVVLPGLTHDDAIAMRETIRSHIRREST